MWLYGSATEQLPAKQGRDTVCVVAICHHRATSSYLPVQPLPSSFACCSHQGTTSTPWLTTTRRAWLTTYRTRDTIQEGMQWSAQEDGCFSMHHAVSASANYSGCARDTVRLRSHVSHVSLAGCLGWYGLTEDVLHTETSHRNDHTATIALHVP